MDRTGWDLLAFRPVARMSKVLGDHLIRDNTTGVLELVKNGYDADADEVLVELRDLADPEKTLVVIQDDGVGMDEGTIRGPWSEPAHGGKEQEKEEMRRTAKGRLPLGEKGVGRFATQKLGRFLDVTTRPRDGAHEYHVHIDWNDFDKTDAYLDEVGFRLEKREPRVFIGSRHGTRLEVTMASTPWRRQNVEKLQASLMRMISPTKAVQNFDVKLVCPEYPELQSLERHDVLEKYQFKIDCRIDGKGIASYEYQHRMHDGDVDACKNDEINLWSRVSKSWERSDPTCGPIRVVISAWLRTAKNLKSYGLSPAKLNALCGISIYRDGFRIVPYGDEGDDWLKLDPRRTNQPGQKYGNNQVIGQVELAQDINTRLVDKTSREGLQENQAFFDMREITLGVMSLLETESMTERTKSKPSARTATILKEEISELKRDILDLKRAAKEHDEGSADGTAGMIDSGNETGPEAKTVPVPAEMIDHLEIKTERIGSAADHAIRDLSEARDDKSEALLHLMGIGMAAERFCHEFDRMVAGLDANLRKLEDKHPYYSWVKSIRLALDSLKNEVALMDVARYVKRPPKSGQSSVCSVIQLSVNAHRSRIEQGVEVEIPDEGDFSVKMSPAALSQVVDNIIENAIYWLSIKTEKDNRRLHIATRPKDRRIVVSNNGPMLSPSVKRAIFRRPFVTTKPNGRGLGMYIASEILHNNGADISYLSEDEPENKYGMTAFAIQFSDDHTRSGV